MYTCTHKTHAPIVCLTYIQVKIVGDSSGIKKNFFFFEVHSISRKDLLRPFYFLLLPFVFLFLFCLKNEKKLILPVSIEYRARPRDDDVYKFNTHNTLSFGPVDFQRELIVTGKLDGGNDLGFAAFSSVRRTVVLDHDRELIAGHGFFHRFRCF